MINNADQMVPICLLLTHSSMRLMRTSNNLKPRRLASSAPEPVIDDEETSGNREVEEAGELIGPVLFASTSSFARFLLPSMI
jgi:hypothetical protein